MHGWCTPSRGRLLTAEEAIEEEEWEMWQKAENERMERAAKRQEAREYYRRLGAYMNEVLSVAQPRGVTLWQSNGGAPTHSATAPEVARLTDGRYGSGAMQRR